MMPPSDDRRPDVQMRAADRAVPRQRRHPQREDDARDPLEAHQAGEQPVGAPVDVVLVRRRTARRRGSVIAAGDRSATWQTWPVTATTRFAVANSGQPNTLTLVGGAGSRVIEQGDDQRRASGVVAGMPARAGDAAAEEQRAAGVVEKRLAGCRGAEPPRLEAIVVAHDRDVGKAAPSATDRSAPSRRRTARLQEEDVGLRCACARAEDLGQFGEAGARAGALRMGEQDERRLPRRAGEPGLGRPAFRERRGSPGCVLVRPEHPQAGDCTCDGSSRILPTTSPQCAGGRARLDVHPRAPATPGVSSPRNNVRMSKTEMFNSRPQLATVLSIVPSASRSSKGCVKSGIIRTVNGLPAAALRSRISRIASRESLHFIESLLKPSR